MKNKLIFTLITATIIFISDSISAKELKNLDMIKQDYINYYNSGEYQKDQAKVIHQATEYLRTRVKNANKKRLAIVLDIDETSLSNYPDMLAMNFGGKEKDVNDAEGKATDPVIAPTLALYRYAKTHHVAVFFITGRTENYRQATEKNLKNVGYTNWNGLFLKPVSYHEKSATPYKIKVRQLIEKQGYKITLNMGDQMSDLRGGYAEKTFKLPNPYYFIP